MLRFQFENTTIDLWCNRFQHTEGGLVYYLHMYEYPKLILINHKAIHMTKQFFA